MEKEGGSSSGSLFVRYLFHRTLLIEFEGVGRAFRFLGCHKFGGEDFRHDLSEYLQREIRFC